MNITKKVYCLIHKGSDEHFCALSFAISAGQVHVACMNVDSLEGLACLTTSCTVTGVQHARLSLGNPGFWTFQKLSHRESGALRGFGGKGVEAPYKPSTPSIFRVQ
eukprot:530196-Pelagomonas_calceolata.AAC.2